MKDSCDIGEGCALPEEASAPGEEATRAKLTTQCPECGGAGREVARQTVLHHVKADRLAHVGDGAYRFCPKYVCALVYYDGEGRSFRTSDLREPVSSKTRGDARPICYCFGFTEGHAREDIESGGRSTIPERISRLIKEGVCACEIRNPSGACCLGQVNETVKRLYAAESREADSSEITGESDCCAV